MDRPGGRVLYCLRLVIRLDSPGTTFTLYLAARKCASFAERALAGDDPAFGTRVGADCPTPGEFPSLSEIQRELALREAARLFDARQLSLPAPALLPDELRAVPDDGTAALEQVLVRSDGRECTVDFLLPVPGEGWRGVLVKPTSKTRQDAVREAAFQWLCLRGAGVPVTGWELVNLHARYLRDGDLDPEQLFRRTDISGRAEALLPEVERESDRVVRMTRDAQRMPPRDAERMPPRDAQTGTAAGAAETHEGTVICAAPGSCPFASECRPELPDHHVFTLHQGRPTADELAAQGILSIGDIPDHIVLSRKQEIQRKAVRTGLPQVDRRSLGRFLRRISYPLFFLDFEAFALSVPPYPGTYPFQHIPFQYSLLIHRDPDAVPEEHEFLARGPEDPRGEIAGRLLPLLEDAGSIVVYDQLFEKRVLSELGEALPEHRARIAALLPRICDLLVPFGSFAYYHPEQKGRASIKRILPLLTGSDYRDLDVSDGGDASARFLAVYHLDRRPVGLPEDTFRNQLLEYCRMDTSAMFRILAVLSGIHADPEEA